MFEKIKEFFKKNIERTQKVVDATLNLPPVKFVTEPVGKLMEKGGEVIDKATGKKHQEEVAILLTEWERLLKACTTRIETLEIGFSKWEERLNKTETHISNLKFFITLSVILNVILVLSFVGIAIKVFH